MLRTILHRSLIMHHQCKDCPYRPKKTVSMAGCVTDITEKALVEEGLAEAEVLIPDLAVSKTRIAGQLVYPVSPLKKPRGFFQSLFSRKSDEDDDFP